MATSTRPTCPRSPGSGRSTSPRPTRADFTRITSASSAHPHLRPQPTAGGGVGQVTDTRAEPGSVAEVVIPQVVLRAHGIQKAYPGVRALRDVDFDLLAGEVHGLVGENAAGKSTLVKIITGALAPDAGVIEAFGRVVPHGDPRARQRSGVAPIYQEPSLVPEMSAAANVFLGRPRRRGPFVSHSETHRAFTRLARQLGVTIHPPTRAASLSVANQQTLEIMRALAADHRILIMD